jgi:hypothetical protein
MSIKVCIRWKISLLLPPCDAQIPLNPTLHRCDVDYGGECCLSNYYVLIFNAHARKLYTYNRGTLHFLLLHEHYNKYKTKRMAIRCVIISLIFVMQHVSFLSGHPYTCGLPSKAQTTLFMASLYKIGLNPRNFKNGWF